MNGTAAQSIIESLGISSLVRCRIRELRRSNTETTSGGVEDGEETFQECHTVNEVKTLSRKRANVVDDEIHKVIGTSDCRVKLGECSV